MQAPRPIPIAFKPSRLRIIVLMILHLAAAFSWLLGFAWGLPGLGVLLLLAASALHQRRRERLACGTLLLLPEGRMQLLKGVSSAPDGGCPEALPVCAQGRLIPASTVHYRAVWLQWVEEGGRRGALMLCQDQCSQEAWRTLQVWLRLEVAPALAQPAAGMPGAAREGGPG